ncbi:hypothetical protein K6I34_006922, partial [Streptomyces sp. UNOC14_S4]|nr:hypothetical protein [Streptomyces sp. UNOC14_S4]
MTHSSRGAYRSQGHRRASRAKLWIISVASIAVLGVVAWQVMAYFEIPPFTDKGKSVSFGQVPNGGGQAGGTSGDADANSPVSMPTGPAADFKITGNVSNGTHVAVTTLEGKKSGFTGKVWVWAPKEYEDPKYDKSGFPVMIALPG